MLQEIQQAGADKIPGAASETSWYSRFLKEGMFDIVYRRMQAAVEVMPVCSLMAVYASSHIRSQQA